MQIYENECLSTCGLGMGDYDDPNFLVPIQNAPPGGLMASAVVKMLIETWDLDDFVDTSEVAAAREFSFVPDWQDVNSDAITIYSGNGNDIVHGSDFGDCIKGGELSTETEPNADDVIFGGPGGDYLEGKAGDDTIYGGTGNDTLFGGRDDGALGGNDWLYGDAGDDTIFGGQDDDKLFGGGNNDFLDGERGKDTYFFNAYDGPEGMDTVNDTGNTAEDAFDTLDFFNAHGGAINLDMRIVGAQTVNGSLTLDLTVFFDAGTVENVIGTDFDDTIKGDALQNQIEGGLGNDKLYGGPDEGIGTSTPASVNDTIHGGPGDDELYGGLDTDDVNLIIDTGDDSLFGDSGDDLLYGEGADDVLDGGLGSDVLYGGPGSDILRGSSDSDILMGGDGNDTLIGGNGWDIGRGGVGSDLIIAEDPDQEADTVKALPIDLTPASDTGVSSTDDITSDNTPTFDVIAVPGTFVELYRATSPGGAGQVVASMTFSQRGLSQLTDTTAPPDGVYYYYITVADSPTDPKSVRSDQLQVTIDTAGPRVTAVTIDGANTFDTAYSIPTGTGALQLKTVPVGGADQVILNFDEAVDVVVADLTLKGRNSSSTVTTFNLTGFIDQAGGAAPWKATWTSSAVFLTESDKYQQMHLTLASGAAGVIDVAGNPLDGFFANPTMLDSNPSQALPSGGGSGADDFTLSYTHLYGDADQTNAVDIGDLNAVRNNFGSTNATWAEGSFDGQGTVDIDELNYVRNNFGVSVTTAWDGSESLMGGGGGAGSSVVMASQESTTSPLIGEEAMRQALRELYSETIAVGKSSPYDGLFGWDLLGDEDWWNVTLGEDAKA